MEKGKIAHGLGLKAKLLVQIPVDEEEVPRCEAGLTDAKALKTRKVRILFRVLRRVSVFRDGKIGKSADASRDGHVPHLPLLV